jgi:type II secretory pathway component PulF
MRPPETDFCPVLQSSLEPNIHFLIIPTIRLFPQVTAVPNMSEALQDWGSTGALDIALTGRVNDLFTELSEIFEESRQSLPIITRAVLGVSLLFQEFWWIVIGALIVFFFVFRQGLRQGRFNQQISNFIWRVPLFGDMSQKEDLSRLTRSLAMLLKNGVSILEALSVSKDIVRNGTLSAEVRRIQEEVSHGSSLSQSFSRSSLFPPLMVNLTAIGEETGALDRSLLRVADVYDKEVDGLSKTITNHNFTSKFMCPISHYD